MLREVSFTVEKLEDESIFTMAICALPEELHRWFTTRVLKVGNGEREVAVTKLELFQLIEAGQTWIALERGRDFADTFDIESLEKMLLIVHEFASLSNLYVVTFSNCEGADFDE